MKSLLIVIDCLRRDHLGCYGYHRDTSPNIDKFAKKATIYKDWRSNWNYTTASYLNIFTGENIDIGLKDDFPKLDYWIDELDISRYAVFACNPLKTQKSFRDHFDLSMAVSMNAKAVTKTAGELLKEKNNYFCLIHFSDCHQPNIKRDYFKSESGENMNVTNNFMEKRGILKRWVEYHNGNRDFNYFIDQYDNAIRYIDECLGEDIFPLDLDNCVITADHSECLGEEGYYFTHHKGCDILYDVPMIVKNGYAPRNHDHSKIRDFFIKNERMEGLKSLGYVS